MRSDSIRKRCRMSKKVITLLVDSEKVEKLDALASTREQDRSLLLNEALDQYLDLNDYHTHLIEQGIADVAAGRVVSHEEVLRALAEQRQRRSSQDPK
jgi:RHH-type transcriptional regulator, rel operon repressor / antitoxin RelB